MRFRNLKVMCDGFVMENYATHFGDIDYIGRYWDFSTHSQNNQTNRTSPFFHHYCIDNDTLYAYDMYDISEYMLDANTYVFKEVQRDFFI